MNESPVTPLCFDLKMRPFRQILSKALEISGKVPLNSKPSSNDRYISYVIDTSLHMTESPCLKSDWLEDIRLFSMKNSKKLLYNKRSNIFPHIGSNETGR